MNEFKKILVVSAISFAPVFALAATACDDKPKPAIGCPAGYTVMCVPVGGPHWACGKEINGQIVTAPPAGGVSQGLGSENRSATGTANMSPLGPALKALLTGGNNKDKDVAEEVLAVVNEYASSSERAAEAKEKVVSRRGWMVFLIGSDYKNLGALRSELVTTQNEIDRLTRARERASDSVVQAEIDAQIQTLEETASNTEAFLEENESKFSIFGWVVRLFSR